MDKRKKLLEKITLKSDIINLILGIALIVSLILIYQNPMNKYSIIAACISGGLMNIMSGIKLMKEPKKKTSGITFVMMGIIVLVLGFFIFEILNKG